MENVEKSETILSVFACEQLTFVKTTTISPKDSDVSPFTITGNETKIKQYTDHYSQLLIIE